MSHMIDHEELERVKKLEDVEWMRIKKAYFIEYGINFDYLTYTLTIYYLNEKNVAQAETLESKTSLHDCKLQAMDFLEGKSK